MIQIRGARPATTAVGPHPKAVSKPFGLVLPENIEGMNAGQAMAPAKAIQPFHLGSALVATIA